MERAEAGVWRGERKPVGRSATGMWWECGGQRGGGEEPREAQQGLRLRKPFDTHTVIVSRPVRGDSINPQKTVFELGDGAGGVVGGELWEGIETQGVRTFEQHLVRCAEARGDDDGGGGGGGYYDDVRLEEESDGDERVGGKKRKMVKKQSGEAYGTVMSFLEEQDAKKNLFSGRGRLHTKTVGDGKVVEFLSDEEGDHPEMPGAANPERDVDLSRFDSDDGDDDDGGKRMIPQRDGADDDDDDRYSDVEEGPGSSGVPHSLHLEGMQEGGRIDEAAQRTVTPLVSSSTWDKEDIENEKKDQGGEEYRLLASLFPHGAAFYRQEPVDQLEATWRAERSTVQKEFKEMKKQASRAEGKKRKY